jgi:hypothetical protein
MSRLMPMIYALKGSAVGSCGCKVSTDCLCWEGEPDHQGCNSFVAHYINQGAIEGIDVASLAVVRLMNEEAQKSLLYVDGKGTDSQQRQLVKAFSGELGGSLATVQKLFPIPNLIRIAPITFSIQTQRVDLWIGNILVQKGMKQTPFWFEG